MESPCSHGGLIPPPQPQQFLTASQKLLWPRASLGPWCHHG